MLDPQFLQLLGKLGIEMQGRIRGSRRGERRSARRGAGGEFLDVRPYTIGDDLRHLDWHLYARLDTLLVRLYEANEEHTIHILLDTSASMGCGKGDYTTKLAAALAYLALASSDTVGIYTVKSGIDARVGPLRGKGSTHRAFDFLSRARFEGETDLLSSVRAFMATRRRGTVVLVSDMMTQDRIEALRVLAGARMRVVVLHTLSGDERDPPLGGELTLVDSESDQRLVVHINRGLRDAYLSRLEAMTRELKESCRAYGIAFVEIDCRTPLQTLVMGDLRRHGLVAG